jgi:hypothetical protein
MTGKVRLFAAAAMVLTAVAAGYSVSNAQAPATTTKAVVYEPFTRSGAVAPGIDVVGRSSDAQCWEGAISSPRADAFRCATRQNEIYDPCFLDPAGPPRLACWRGPGPTQVVLVTPEQPFPQRPHHGSANVESGFPWLIKLSNGQYCADQTGASLYFRSIGRANWSCPDGLGWGTIHRHGQEWTMGYSSLASALGRTAPRLTQIPIATAWF